MHSTCRTEVDEPCSPKRRGESDAEASWRRLGGFWCVVAMAGISFAPSPSMGVPPSAKKQRKERDNAKRLCLPSIRPGPEPRPMLASELAFLR